MDILLATRNVPPGACAYATDAGRLCRSVAYLSIRGFGPESGPTESVYDLSDTKVLALEPGAAEVGLNGLQTEAGVAIG